VSVASELRRQTIKTIGQMVLSINRERQLPRCSNPAAATCYATSHEYRLTCSDHTIVTSDSLGSVTFWDGASMAQKQTFSAHKADGMCLTIGPVGSSYSRVVIHSADVNRTEQQSTLPVQTNESVNSPTCPRPLNSLKLPQNVSIHTTYAL
jgi:hypothetical protein